jgi:hypothetical protein
VFNTFLWVTNGSGGTLTQPQSTVVSGADGAQKQSKVGLGRLCIMCAPLVTLTPFDLDGESDMFNTFLGVLNGSGGTLTQPQYTVVSGSDWLKVGLDW